MPSQCEWCVKEKFTSSWQATWYVIGLWFVLFLFLDCDLYHKAINACQVKTEHANLTIKGSEIEFRKGAYFWIYSCFFTGFLTLLCYKWVLSVDDIIHPVLIGHSGQLAELCERWRVFATGNIQSAAWLTECDVWFVHTWSTRATKKRTQMFNILED